MLVAFVVRSTRRLRSRRHNSCATSSSTPTSRRASPKRGGSCFAGEPLRLSLLYPVLLAPAWLAERMATTYAVAKTTNVALMTVSVVPLYLLGRRLVDSRVGALRPY